jgi:hypothetical protein
LKTPRKCIITILENGKQGFELPEVMAKRGKEVGENFDWFVFKTHFITC